MQVNKNHRYCRTPYGFQMSPYLQEKVVFSGQNCVFEDASDQIAQLMGVEVSAKQVERLTHAYGQLLETTNEEEEVSQSDDMHYCMVDGSMVLTREDDWKEMKLFRMFQAGQHMNENQKRKFIRESSYTAHLGGCSPSFKKVKKQTDNIKNRVWICDGAKWIWNWIERNYPESRQILDWYHCSEKLHNFAHQAIKDNDERRAWVSQQEELLLNSQTNQVMEAISRVSCKGKARQMQRSILTYYENNLKRMDYKTYQKEGLLIGSGPIEAAHRNLIQARMKLSGQRWTIKGAQQVANLRTANQSGKWQKVLDLINLN